MRAFQRTIFTVVSMSVLLIGFVTNVEAEALPTPVPFKLECLPSTKDTLAHIEVRDTDLKCLKSPKIMYRPKTEEESKKIKENIKNECTLSRGIFKDNGSVVTCTLSEKANAKTTVINPKPAAYWQSLKTTAQCKTAGGVWAGPDGTGGCTGPTDPRNKKPGSI